MDRKPTDFERSFDINSISFENVSKDFEKKFREKYYNSLKMMSDSKDRLDNASGANSLGILERMAQRISDYNSGSDFEYSYHQLLKEYEPFTET